MPTSTDLQRAIQLVDDLFDELRRYSGQEDANLPEFQGLQEVLFTLEEVQSVHEQLDKLDVPRQHPELGELSLFARVHWLAANFICGNRPEMHKDFYGGSYQPKTDQPRLLERRQAYRHRGDVAEFKVPSKLMISPGLNSPCMATYWWIPSAFHRARRLRSLPSI